MKKINAPISIILAMLMIATPLAALPLAVGGESMPVEAPMFPGGDGSIGDPYQISNVTELQWMGNLSNLDKHFKLVNDIDASETFTDPGSWPLGFDPIGDNVNAFVGTLDGCGYTITGLYINRPAEEYIALLGYLGVGSGIENLFLENCTMTGSDFVGGIAGRNDDTIANCSSIGSTSGGQFVGGFVGYNDGSVTNCSSTGSAGGTGSYVGGFVGLNIGTITKCYSAGNASGTGSYVGGFIGDNYATITNCHSTGSASETASALAMVGGFVGRSIGTITYCSSTGSANGVGDEVGGFAGENSAGGILTNCFSTGNANGEDTMVGGFIGNNNGGTITNCYSTGDAAGIGNFDAGFAGYNSGTITNSYSKGSATGAANVGGFVGTNSGPISNCYSTASASGTGNVGGFVGFNADTLTNCYSTGNASGGGATGGGFAGLDGGTITNCFWDITTSGRSGSDGGSGGTTTDLMNILTFTTAGWDFASVWWMVNASTRPFLRMEWDTEIRNSHQLQLMQMDLAADYTLAKNIDMSDIVVPSQMWGTSVAGGDGFLPVGNATDLFTGSLDGSDFEISDLFINRSLETNVGLFGRIVTPAEITNVTLTNANVSGGENTATLVGYSAGGTLKNCHVACEVWGYGNFVGGLMGYNNPGTVDNSSFDGNVTANVNYVGGLIGRSTGPVTYCSSSGIVDGGNWVGGLIGDTIGTGFVESCTSTSTVSGGMNVGGLLGVSGRPIGNSSAFGDVSGGNQVGGLVGYNSATIMNCNSTGNATAIGAGDYLGGLVGRNEGGTLTDCHSTGDTSGDWYLGGFIGYSTGSITNCTSTGTVSGSVTGSRQGGFVGENNGPITNCSSTGNASGSDVSGFIGINHGPITNCHSTGNVNGTGNAIGGFVGWNDDTITTSYSTGNAIGVEDVGGFLGDNVGGTITKCFSTGDVTGTSGVNSYAGGFIGVNDAGGQIMNCYSRGNAIGAGNYNGGFAAGNYNSIITNCYSIGNASGGSNTGGFLGFNSTATTTDCFWDVEYSGTIPSDGGTPKNTAEMKQQATFTNWDFATIWGIYEYNTYPFLQAIGPTYVPDADLEITIGGTPEPCNVGDALMYMVTVTNNGPDIAVNPVVNITLPVEVTWLNDSQGIGPPTGQYLEAIIGNLDSGETGGSFINVSADTYAAVISATAKIVSDTADSNLSNNIDWANTTLNRVPTAGDDDYQTTEDYIQTVNAPGVLNNDLDPDLDPLTVINHEPSDYGAAITVNANGSFTYDPTGSSVLQGLHNGESLNDTFNYTISDGRGGTTTALITIQVDGNDDAPTANNDTFTIDEDSGPNTLDVLANDVGDEEGDDFFITHGSGAAHGTLTVSADGQMLIYEQTHTNYTGYDVFTYMISDGNITDTASVNLTITPVNDAPHAQGGVYWVDEDSGPNTLYVLAAAIDAEGDDLTITVVTQPNDGAVVITESGKNLTYEPDADFFGNDYFNYTISDGNGGTDTHMVTVRVNNTNDDPVITTTSLTEGVVGSVYTLTLESTDIDSNTQIWSGTSSAIWLTIGSNGVLSGTPTVAGSFWVNIELSDGAGGSDTANLTLIVTGIADDMDGDGIPDATDPDIDGDGVDNAEDAFPEDAAETVDTDGDGIGNNADTDDDGDGIPDTEDDNPLVPADTGGNNTWLYILLILVIVGAIAGFLLMRGKGAKPAEEPEAIEEADSMGSAESVEGSDGTAPEDDIEDLTLE